MIMYNSDELSEKLKTIFGFSQFLKGQQEVIGKILQGQSVLAIFPTGAGKSLCYQLPSVLLPGITLVVSPLLSLMHDQLQFLKMHSIPAAALDSTLSREQYQKVLQKAKNGELKVLMISVERFKNERFRNSLQNMNISLLVVDEAHCISEWGHNFRPEYLKIPVYKKEFSINQVLLLTATATSKVADDICGKFDIKEQNLVRTGFYRKNLSITVYPVKNEEKISLLVKRLKDNTEKMPSIVYVTLQKTAQMVADELNRSGIGASPYHAGMKDDERVRIQNGFMNGTINCVVATIAFGMGIDKSNIRSIIHFDLPKSIEGYTQEIGRGGRDGLGTSCLLFANKSGITTLQNFVYGDTPERESINKLVQEISEAGNIWEVQLVSLSNRVNVRQLPLKTALVYLEMEGILSSLYSYFSEYRFKASLSGAEILSNYNGESRNFLGKLLKYAVPKKVWIDIDLVKFAEETGYERKRAVTALEHMDEKGFIELEARQAIDVFRVMSSSIDIEATTDKIHAIFETREHVEVNRVNEMISLFEHEKCLSNKLARYFCEELESDECGHCSVCKSGSVKMYPASECKPLQSYDIEELTAELVAAAKQPCSPVFLTRFLCGISTPAFTALKATRMKNFGVLGEYPYQEVLQSMEKTLQTC